MWIYFSGIIKCCLGYYEYDRRCIGLIYLVKILLKYIYICIIVLFLSIYEVRLNLYNFYLIECFGVFGINCLVLCDNKLFGY